MSNLTKQIIVTSANREINKAKKIGFLDLSPIALYTLYNYYIDFADSLINEGETSYIAKKKCLQNVLNKLIYLYPNQICNYKAVIGTTGNGGTTTPNTNPGGTGSGNNAPTVSGITIPIGTNVEYTFQISDFITNYSDPQGDLYNLLIIYPSGVSGTFKYNGVELTTTTQISIFDVGNLTYTRNGLSSFSVNLPFRVSDNNSSGYLFSSLVSNTITGTVIANTENQPATIGDNTIVISNRAVIVLTLDMFTSQLTPPYSDPESDLIDAIRLNEISTANHGTFYFNGVPVVAGQIILREDINNNLFTYSSADEDDLWSDNFYWSARDEGSGIWVD